MKTLYLTILYILLILISSVFIILPAHCQPLDVRLGMHSPYLMGMEDLWNVSIENRTSENLIVELHAEVRDRQQNLLGKARSVPVQLSPGLNILSRAQVITAEIHFSDADLSRIVNQSRYLPPGSYVFCLEVTQSSTRIGIDCKESNIESINPPVLILPTDGAELEAATPIIFNWLPPVPLTSTEGITYTFQLTELLPYQHASAAIKSNLPHFYAEGLNENRLVYPPDAKPLDTAKSYAWIVYAHFKGYSMGNSEVWQFRFKNKDTIDLSMIPNIQSYIDLRTVDPVQNYYFLGEVKIKYIDKNGNGKIMYEIMDIKGKKLKVSNNELITHRGDNRFIIDMSSIRGIYHLDNYTVYLKDHLNNEFILRGVFIDPNLLDQKK